MLKAIFRPLHAWPGKENTSRKNSPFSAGFAATLDLLEREFRHVQARNVVIQAFFRADQIRQDGWPKGAATPSAPGVILTFERFKGYRNNWSTSTPQYDVVSMPCDRFRLWIDNLRAIALSLEALRMVDRYGVTQNGEQYRGFTQLPAPGAEASIQTGAQALTLLKNFTGWKIEEIIADIDGAYRAAAKVAHPDVGGSEKDFVMITEAREFLRKHGNGSNS